MTIEEIQKAIKELSPSELVLFRNWFLEFDAKFSESNPELTMRERLRSLRGSLKGQGILKAFMDEKKRERDL